MAEYIKREDVIEITAETGALETQARVMVLPSADVEEVVHCKDCKFYLHTANKCLLTGRYATFENDFCSDAEEESDG